MKYLIVGVCCVLCYSLGRSISVGESTFEEQKAIQMLAEEREQKLWRLCLETTQDIDKCVALIKYGRKYNLGE